ncbi:MAG: sulfurtransferase TusA family protein [Candidatus Omnitrophota bacterium]|nr:sulfurtransferase TusA family protein [Candidatus Omnitrophota bacterium]
MIKGYDLPAQLESEISGLEELLNKYKRGEISATELKAHRVPFGVYEQRQADTYMVRIRCAGGFISPEQLEGVSTIAQEFGIGDLHLTSRQELQLHYVKLDHIIAIMRRLLGIGLSTRGGGGNTVRNIGAQADAGIDPQEVFDVSPYVEALTTRLIAESDSWNLPRKFKIAFSGSIEDKGYATLSDVGFIAKIKDNKKGFKVYAAGGLGAKPAVAKLLLDFIEADEVYAVAKALKTLFFKYGNRKNKHAARLRFLWLNLGEQEFKKRFDEEYALVKAQKLVPLAISSEAESVIDQSVAGQSLQTPDFLLWRTRYAHPQKQKGLFSILIPVELGFISCANALKLTRFLKIFGSDVLRMTKDQNFLVRNIHEKSLAEAYNLLKEALPEVSQPALYGKILSCAGASTCQLGICYSRQAARAAMNELKKSGLDLDKIGEIKINISGCPNSCGQHPAADLGFSGKALRGGEALYPAYNIFAGAVIRDGETKLAELIGEVPAKALPLLVKDFLARYIGQSGKFVDFQQYFLSEGRSVLKEIIPRYAQVPKFEEDKNYYFDWGETKLFSLAERKAGECSAGFFDLLEMDLRNISKTQAALSAEGNDQIRKEKLLGELVFFASRVLLITRGLDAKSEEEVYAGFLKHFIESGLINQSFQNIVAAARVKDIKAIAARESEALDLGKAVLALYETMDNTFNFKTEVARQGSVQKTDAPAVVKDFRGVACPLNFVKTKVELAKLKPGDLLEIWLDDGAPIENVPGSVQAEGHKILAQKKTGDYWSVIIEKKG